MTSTMQKSQSKTDSWSAIFPTEQVTETQSLLFVKKLLAVAISNITYLRAIFPETAFGDRCLEDLNLKILKDDSSCGGACTVIKWVKGCFDALDKKYLKMLVVGIYVDPDDPDTVIESYTFKFSYKDNGGIDIYRNDKKVSSAFSMHETKKATIRLLRTIVVLTQTLQSLPDDVMMTMKLFYYDGTPADYEPPGFKASSTSGFVFEEEATNIIIGDVSTPFHTIKMRIKTDSKQFEAKEDNFEVDGNKNISENSLNGNGDAENQQDEDLDVVMYENSSCNNRISPVRKQSLRNSPEAVVPSADLQDDDAAIECKDKSQISQENFFVRCPCGYNEDDGLMILCDICNNWQHGVCFLVQSEEEAPAHHVCDNCADLKDPQRQPTDLYLNSLTPIGVQATCLWRRTLIATAEMKKVIAPNLSNRLGVEMNVAQGLLNRLEKEGFVSNKGKRLGKMVNREKILSEGILKYFQKKNMKRNDELCMEDDVKNNNSPKEINEENSIDKLSMLTENMDLSRPKQKRKGRKKQNLTIQSNETNVDNQEKRGKKRVFSKTEDIEFDVSSSQDLHSEKSSKIKKASIVSKALLV